MLFLLDLVQAEKTQIKAWLGSSAMKLPVSLSLGPSDSEENPSLQGNSGTCHPLKNYSIDNASSEEARRTGAQDPESQRMLVGAFRSSTILDG